MRVSFALAACALQAVVVVATTHVFIGDAPNYASDIAEHLRTFSCNFYEAGHLFWRPMGLGLTAVSRGLSDTRALQTSALVNLTRLSVLFGLASAALLASWLRVLVPTLAATVGGAAFGVVFLLTTSSFMNFSQVGTSYVPALAFLLLGMALLPEASRRPRTRDAMLLSGAAGSALSMSVLLWGPFLLVLPAGLLSVVVLEGPSRPRLAQAAIATVTSALAAVAVLAWIAWELRIGSVEELAVWAGAASHGIDMVGGLPRAVMGLARSVVYLQDVGTLVKQYLMHDPAASVGLRDIFTGELVVFVLFYFFLAGSIAGAALSSGGRRALLLLLIAGVPLGWFAVAWQGGDLERYLPLLPFMALVISVAFSNLRGRRWLQRGMVAFLVLAAAINASVMLNGRIESARAPAVARLEEAATPGAGSLLVVPTHQDEVWQVQRNYPSLLSSYPGTQVVYLVLPGTPQVEDWPQDFARHALTAWDEGKEVLLSRHLLVPAPERDWGWTEGEDPRIRWSDLTRVAVSLLGDRSAGATADGFVVVPQTPQNRERLERLAGDGESESERSQLTDRIEACPFPPRRALREASARR